MEKVEKYIIAIAAVAAACFGASASEMAGELNDSTLRLGEVTVTAIKQGENVSLQPIATTIVGEAQIERYNITSMKGISELAPNFYLPEYGSRMTSSIYVRGLGARIDQPSVGLNVDNVPFLNKDAFDFDLTDIDRIEVLRGAQSSLYGRNTMAGQINIYTLSPKYFQGTRLKAQVGTGPEASLALSHYAKTSERTAMGFSGNFNFSDGFFKNYYNAKKVGTDKSLNLRWKTDWTVSKEVSLNNVASFSFSRQGGYPYELLGSDVVNYNDTCYYRRNLLSDGLTVKWTRGDFSLSSITSVQYLDDNMTLDQDFTPLNIFTLSQRRHELSLTQDVVVKGKKGIYSWLVGAFGFMKRGHMNAPVKIKDEGIETLITDRVNNNDKIPIKLRWDDEQILLGDDFTLPVWGVAAYHQSTLELDKWTMGVGLRLDYESTGLNYRSYSTTSYSIIMPNGAAVPQTLAIDNCGRLRDHFLELLPKFTVSYKLPMKNASEVYASVGKGYKSGGFNTQMFSDIVQQEMMEKMMEGMPGGGTGSKPYDVKDILSYEPEKSWNYEVGAHVECAGGRVRTDLALFYIDCRNQQLTMFPAGSTTGRITTNADKCRMWGVEAQVKYSPTERWLFNASYGYTNAKFATFVVGEVDYKGNYVPYAPMNTLFVSCTYRQPLPWKMKMLEFTAGARGVGQIYWNEENSAKQPFYAEMFVTATARFGWLDAEVWMENVSGTDYDVFYFKSMGNSFVQKGKPRRAGVTLRLNF